MGIAEKFVVKRFIECHCSGIIEFKDSVIYVTCFGCKGKTCNSDLSFFLSAPFFLN
jgi:hypothetical protein